MADNLPATRSDIEASYVPAHPEEIHGAYDLRIGNLFRLQGTGRVTPAGLICGCLGAAAVLLATAVVVRAVRR
ncbi:hypothetical protein LGR54_02245 [Ancylobacter sp. Lp-2]|uniref:hypothetical protein n=1 Tax=Ancylobacter sp. Lp-2 TaxID=2881339 RepID=UPI001E4CB848|nr:hypothetical protein [Ancylobacter sp. Lp-2]MCB4767413.1 hypothetical protein [Ancylobacter sp. Lp-2]